MGKAYFCECGRCQYCLMKKKANLYAKEIDRLNMLLVGADCERLKILGLLREAYMAAISTPVMYRGDALRWRDLCDRMLEVIGVDPIEEAAGRKEEE
jgi:hypothetical protein